MPEVLDPPTSAMPRQAFADVPDEQSNMPKGVFDDLPEERSSMPKGVFNDLPSEDKEQPAAESAKPAVRKVLSPRLGRVAPALQPVVGYIPETKEATESIFGLSPEMVPAGKTPATSVLSAVGKAAVGVGAYGTSPQGFSEALVATTPGAPLVLAKWAYDMVKGTVDSVKGAVEETGALLRDWINRQIISNRNLGLDDKATAEATQEHIQALAEHTVNAALMASGAIGTGAHAVSGAAKAVAPLVTPKPETLAARAMSDEIQRHLATERPIIPLTASAVERLPDIEAAAIAGGEPTGRRIEAGTEAGPPQGPEPSWKQPILPKVPPSRVAGSEFRPTVPETAAEAQRDVTVLEEIRNAGARTIGQIQQLFPKAEMNRERARALRDAAWPEQAKAHQETEARIKELLKEKGPEDAIQPEAAQPVRPVREPSGKGVPEVPVEGKVPPDDEGRGKAPDVQEAKVVAPQPEAPAKPDVTKPYLVAAAVQDPQTGEWYRGPHHPAVEKHLGMPETERTQRETDKYGFVVQNPDGTKRVVSRTEATEIAKANNQAIEEFEPGTQLHSDMAVSAVEPDKLISETKQPVKPVEPGKGVSVAKEPWQMTAEEAVKVTGLTWDKWQDAIRAAEKSGKLKETDPASISASKTGIQTWRDLKSKAQKAIPPAAAPEPAKPAIPPEVSGKRGPQGTVPWSSSTPVSNEKVSGSWEVLDASDPVTSGDAGYDQDLQPRDRSRVASKEQIAEMARKHEPERLVHSPTTDLGAPIVDDLNQVLSGNGRMAALRAVYAEGGEKANAYRHHIEQEAAKLGISPDKFKGIQSPVLVRRIQDYGGLSKTEFTRKSNEQQVLGMSDAEKAGRDAAMLRENPGLLDSFLPSEEGDVLAASNRGFLNSFIEGTGDRADLISADGSYNAKKLIPRVKNAVLGALLGHENRRLLNDLIDRAEELNIKKPVTGVMNAAPRLMKFRGANYDLASTLGQAFSDLVRIKGEGMKLNEFLDQDQLFRDPQRSAESDFLLSRLAEARSAKDIAEGLARYAELAGKIDLTTGDIFGGEPTPRPELLKRAYAEPTVPKEEQPDLTLGKPPQPPSEPEGPAGAAGPGVPVPGPKPTAPAEPGAKPPEPVDRPRTIGKVTMPIKEQFKAEPAGLCFSNARKWALKNGGEVIHGKLTIDGERFDHAWVEKGGDVIDPTTGVRVDKFEFYKATKAEADARYTPENATALMVRARHDGPYTIEEAKGRFISHNGAPPALAEGSVPPGKVPPAAEVSRAPAPAAPEVKPEPAPPKPIFKPEEQKRIDEIKALLKKKFGDIDRGKTLMGLPLEPFDAELFKLGGELAYHYMKAGVRRFGDFASHMISELGDAAKKYLLSWYSNAKLQLKEHANEFDSDTDAKRIYDQRFQPADARRPAVPGGVGGGGGAGGRPGVRVAREELIPQPKQYVGIGGYEARSGFRLNEEQVRGINLILDWFNKNPERGAHLLGDGPGFGKTAQELAVADQYRKQGLGERILIVTQNKQVAETRFKADAARMGIDPNIFTLTTFTSLKNLTQRDWDLVIYDEAHNLKNGSAQKSMAAARLRAKHELFATATPMDRPTGAAYFLSKITGKDYLQIARELGYTFQQREDPLTREIHEYAVPLPGMNWQKIWNNIMAHRDAAVSAGAMIRREYPFYGEVNTHNLPMEFDSKMEQERLIKYYDNLIERARTPTAKRNYAGQKTLTLSRWSEQRKLKAAVDMAEEHLKKGGQVIIVAETDKRQSFPQPIAGSVPGEPDEYGRPRWYVDGAITQLNRMLAERGITDIADIHDPTKNTIALEVGKFQRGEDRVALATPQSGGTGIDLDDVKGNRPRLMIALSKNFAGDTFEQLVGRVSRMNTASPAEVRFLNLRDSFADERRNDVLDKKVRTLKAIQGGEEVDVAGGFDPNAGIRGGGAGAERFVEPEPTEPSEGIYPPWASPGLAAGIKRAMLQKPGEFAPFPEWEDASPEQKRALMASGFNIRRSDTGVEIAPKFSQEKRTSAIKFTDTSEQPPAPAEGEVQLGSGGTVRTQPPTPTPVAATPEEAETIQHSRVPGLETLRSISKGIKSLLLPSAIDKEHLRAAEVLGSKLGPMHHDSESAAVALRKDTRRFDRMGVHRSGVDPHDNPGMKFMSDMSQGRELTGKDRETANTVQRLFKDRLEKLAAADAPLEKVRENYFPGMWTKESRLAFNLAVDQAMKEGILGKGADLNFATDAQKAWIKERVGELIKQGRGLERDALQYLTKRPIKGRESFRKPKVFDDIMTGAELGLEPISNNPMDLVKLKLAEMDRSIMANRYFQELKERGELRVINPYSQVPQGWTKINDKYGTIYGPPTVEEREFVDKNVYDGLMNVARGLGISPKRVFRAGRGRLGYASTTGETVSQFATELSVLAHELGHQLDYRYGLWDRIVKGSKPGERSTIQNELRALADLSWEGRDPAEVSDYYKRQVRKKREKMAHMLEAYIHAPDKFKQVAPTVYRDFDGFIKSKPELRALSEIKPGISLEKLENERYVGMRIMGYRIVPEAHGRIMNNYLSSSLYNSPYFGKLYTGWMAMANTLNQSQLGVGSFFHAGFTTMEAQISANANVLKDIYGVARGNRMLSDLGKSAKQAAVATVRTGFVGDEVLNAWRHPDGRIDPRIAQVVKAMELGGAGARLEKGMQTRQYEKTYRDWYSKHKLRAAMRSPVAMLELMAKPVMDFIVPRQKAGVFADMAWRIIDQHPDTPLEELTPQFRQAWNRIDARLGQVQYDRLFMNNVAKNVVQATVRAPGWSGGTIAELGGAFPDAVKFLSEWVKTGKAPENIPDRTAYALSLILTVGAVNGALTYAFTGQKPTGLDYVAFRTGRKDENGNEERFLLPTYMKDLLAYARETGRTLVNKSHPVISLVGDVIRGRDYYGTEIRSPDDSKLAQAGETAKYVLKSFEPFWTRGARKATERGAGPLEIAGPFVGVMPAPANIANTEAERLASELMRAQLPQGARTREQFERAQKERRAVQAIKSGRMTSTQAVDQGLVPVERQRTIERRAEMPYLEYAVRRLSIESAIRVYQKANESERRQLHDILASKLRDARSLSQERKEQLRQKLETLK